MSTRWLRGHRKPEIRQGRAFRLALRYVKARYRLLGKQFPPSAMYISTDHYEYDEWRDEARDLYEIGRNGNPSAITRESWRARISEIAKRVRRLRFNRDATI